MKVEEQIMEEEQAIVRLKNGDLSGLEALVSQHQVQAVTAAYLIVQDLKLAEDIVQTAFLHAAEKINQFDETRPFRPWFLKSVIHAAIKADKQQRRLISIDEDNFDETAEMIRWLSDPDQDPQKIVETEEIRQMVRNALLHMTTEQRAVIIMRYFLDMSEKEMIQSLNRPSTTVRWRLRAARKKLKALLLPLWAAEDKRSETDGERKQK